MPRDRLARAAERQRRLKAPHGVGGAAPRKRERKSSKQSGSRDPRYDTPEWRALRAQVRREQPTCACGKSTRFADHITPEKEGGDFWARSNLQGLCSTCHGRKSRAEQGERGEKPKARPRVQVDPETGMPLDGEDHWWAE